jgi:hypothetical protein
MYLDVGLVFSYDYYSVKGVFALSKGEIHFFILLFYYIIEDAGLFNGFCFLPNILLLV